MLASASQGTVSTPPTPARQIGGSISNQDYPADALLARSEGTVQIRLTVGENGRVTACSVLEPSGHSALDSTTCALVVRRFRFAPATIDGRPVGTTVTRRISWRLPVQAPEPAAPASPVS